MLQRLIALTKSTKYWVMLLAFTVAQFFFAIFGLSLATLDLNTSPFWPSTGFAIGIVFLYGYRFSLAIFLGTLLATFFVAGTALGPGVLMSLGGLGEAIFGAYTVRYIFSKKMEFEYLSEVIAVVSASLLAPVLSAFLGTLGVAIGVAGAAFSFTDVWLTWWTGNFIGGLTVLPLILAIKTFPWRHFTFRPGQIVQYVLLTVLLLVFLYISFKYKFFYGTVFIVFPILLLISLYLGPLSLFSISFGACIFAVYLTVHEIGPFTGGYVNENLLNLQLFLASVALTSLVLDSLKRTRRMRLSAIVLLISWGLSSLLFYSFHAEEHRKDLVRFERLVNDVQNSINVRMSAYIDALYGGMSLFAVTSDITPQRWKAFYETYQVDKRYPGIKGIGVIWPIKETELNSFIEKQRIMIPRFSVKPVAGYSIIESQKKYGNNFIITYIEPLEPNKESQGLDVGSEIHRRFAAEASRDSGMPYITENIVLAQDIRKGPGFLLFLPFYKPEVKLTTVELRRRYHLGWVYAPFITQEFFEGILKADNPEISMTVFSGDVIDKNNLIFNSKGNAAIDSFEKISDITLAGVRFTIGWQRTAAFESTRSTTVGWVTLGCSILSLLFSIVISTLQSIGFRAQAIAREKTAELSRSERRARAIVESSIIGTVISDGSGIIMECNSPFLKMIGYKLDDVKARRLEWSKMTTDASFLNSFQKLRATGTGEFAGEITLQKKDGTSFPALIGNAPLAGQIFQTVSNVIDLTERKKIENELIRANEEALKGAQAKASFMANMSHEIRTPLNGIIGVADLLFETELTDEQKRYAEIIQNSSNNLLTIINDILDFSKIEAGKLQLESISFNIASLTEEQTDLMIAKARRKGLSLMSYIDPFLPPELIGDPSRISQILSNLISNALKFTKTGGVRISVTKAKRQIENHHMMVVRFEITDTGIGIAEENLGKLFQAFSQIDDSTSRQYGGSGLGLSICKNLIDLMGGQIGVHTQKGQGSTFWFEVPLKVHGRSLAKMPFEDFTAVTSLKVLVADDDAITRDVLNAYLLSLGINTQTVHNIEEAERAIKNIANESSPVDVAFIGSKSHFEKTLHIAKKWKHVFASDIPKLVLMTEFENNVAVDTVKAHGFFNLLRKPLKQMALFEILSTSVKEAPSFVSEVVKVKSEEFDGEKKITLTPRRVLVVDDIAVNRQVIEQMVEKLGYSASAVASGKEALQALALIPFDVVLMDIQMPEMDGYQATQYIRNSFNERIKETVVIALTANALEGDKAKCLAAGMDDYLAKPVKKSMLEEKLKIWFDFIEKEEEQPPQDHNREI